MLKTKTFLGIDIGTTNIKMVEFELKKNVPHIINCAISPIYINGSAEENQENRNERIALIVKNILKEKKFKSNVAAISISSKYVFTRFVKMPFSDKKKLDRLINFEAQQQIPFPLDEVSWDYQIVGKNKDQEFEVLIAAIKKDILEQAYQSLSRISVTPAIFDIGALGLYNALLYAQIQKEEKIIILDIGDSPATLIIHQPSGYWIRTISYSGNSITQTIIKEFNISHEKAESLKFQGKILEVDKVVSEEETISCRINQLITQNVKKLHTEIVRSLNFYRAQFNDIAFDKIILSGGGAKLNGLQTFLQSKFGVPVEFANPSLAIQTPDEMENISHLFSNAIGLSLRQMLPCKVSLNLMTSRAILESSIKNYLKYIYFIISVLILTFGFSGFYIKGYLKTLESEAKQTEELKKSYQTLVKEMSQYKNQNAEIENQIRALKRLPEGRNFWYRFYLELNQLVTPEIYFTSFSMQRDMDSDQNSKWEFKRYDISLLGVSENRKALDSLKENLSKIKALANVEIVKASIDQNKKIDFGLRLQFRKDYHYE